jgi:hypothetical protein
MENEQMSATGNLSAIACWLKEQMPGRGAAPARA